MNGGAAIEVRVKALRPPIPKPRTCSSRPLCRDGPGRDGGLLPALPLAAVSVAILWLWKVDGISPDRWDLLGMSPVASAPSTPAPTPRGSGTVPSTRSTRVPRLSPTYAARGVPTPELPSASKLSAVNRAGWATDSSWHSKVGNHYNSLSRGSNTAVASPGQGNRTNRT